MYLNTLFSITSHAFLFLQTFSHFSSESIFSTFILELNFLALYFLQREYLNYSKVEYNEEKYDYTTSKRKLVKLLNPIYLERKDRNFRGVTFHPPYQKFHPEICAALLEKFGVTFLHLILQLPRGFFLPVVLPQYFH